MNFSAFLCIPRVVSTSIAPVQIMTFRIVLLFIVRLSLTNLRSKHSLQHPVPMQIQNSTLGTAHAVLYVIIYFAFIEPPLNTPSSINQLTLFD